MQQDAGSETVFKNNTGNKYTHICKPSRYLLECANIFYIGPILLFPLVLLLTNILNPYCSPHYHSIPPI